MKAKRKPRSNRVASDELLGAAAEYERAGKALVAATKKACPIGTRVLVTLGNARVEVEVEDAGGCWWMNPARVLARNVSTGKLRSFHGVPDGDTVLILSTPNDWL